MAKLSDFKQDTSKMVEGVWREAHGVRLLVARYNNPAFQRELQRLLKPHRRKLRPGKELAIDVLQEISRKAMAKHVLLGWEDITDDDGEAILFSPEKAAELLLDPENVLFAELVQELAQEEDAYTTDEEEADSKN